MVSTKEIIEQEHLLERRICDCEAEGALKWKAFRNMEWVSADKIKEKIKELKKLRKFTHIGALCNESRISVLKELLED